MHLPSAFESETADARQPAARTPRRRSKSKRSAIKTFGLPLLSRTIVVAHRPAGLHRRRRSRQRPATSPPPTARKAGRDPRRAAHRRAGAARRPQKSATTLVVYLYIHPSLSESEQQQAAEDFAAGLQRATGADAAKVTGALPATRAETERRQRATSSGSRWRPSCSWSASSPSTSARSGFRCSAWRRVGVAYLGVDRVLGWIGRAATASRSRSEVEPVIIALLFGVLTDYLVFFVSGYRQRLRAGAEPLAGGRPR